MNISNYFNLPRGHSNFDFVDINTDYDTELFIDPCLIEIINTPFSYEAMYTLNDYFDSFYDLYRSNHEYSDKTALFCHAHEINATKLGYGNGNNGKAKTAAGMIQTFEQLKKLIDSKVPLSKAIDLPIFIRDFAEDCLSDMLTNILFLQLSNFTIEQCKKYSIDVQDVKEEYHYWDYTSHCWAAYRGKGLFVDGKIILLVPKNIVRHNFYYNTEQYFRSVILEKMQDEQTTYDSKGKANAPTKKHLRESLLKNHSDILDISEANTISTPNLLDVHHNRLRSSYNKRGMNDEDLDYWAYN